MLPIAVPMAQHHKQMQKGLLHATTPINNQEPQGSWLFIYQNALQTPALSLTDPLL